MTYAPLTAMAEAQLHTDMDGDVISEIGLFTLIYVSWNSTARDFDAFNVNESEAVKGSYEPITGEDLEPFVGWNILQQWEDGDGSRFHLSRYDGDSEASEAFTAMQETYFAEIGE